MVLLGGCYVVSWHGYGVAKCYYGVVMMVAIFCYGCCYDVARWLLWCYYGVDMVLIWRC